MDSTKIMDKDFVKVDLSPNFNYQTWFWKVYLILCENKVELCVDLQYPIITHQSTQEEKEKYQKWMKNFILRLHHELHAGVVLQAVLQGTFC